MALGQHFGDKNRPPGWRAVISRAKRRCIPGYVRLQVFDRGQREVIPRSMRPAAVRTARVCIRTKGPKGAFRADRCHATAVETDEHLVQCLVTMDLNMVRGGARRALPWEGGDL